MPREKPRRLQCENHGEHPAYITFSDPAWPEEVRGLTFCLQDIVEYLVESGGEEMAEVIDE